MHRSMCTMIVELKDHQLFAMVALREAAPVNKMALNLVPAKYVPQSTNI